MSDWRLATLDQLGTVERGRSRHRPRGDPTLFSGDYPFFQTGDVKAAEFHLRDYTQTYNNIGLAQSRLWEPGTLCITIAANIAESAVLAIPACFPDSVVGFVPTGGVADVRYVKYLLDHTKLRMQAISRGTTQDNLSLDKLLSFEFPVPDLDEQRKIAAVLAAYDELIENNLRRIEVLEEMAQEVYREWFVNFRFPSYEDVAMVDSPLGPIPEGWEVSTLGDESSVVMGQSPKSEFYNDDGNGLPFHQGVTYFGTLFPEHVKYCTVESRIAEAGDTLVSVRAPVGRINVADTRMVIGRGLAAIRNLEDECPGFHYRQLRHVSREEDSMGGGTIYKAITKGDLVGVHWLVPPDEIKAAFEDLERPLFSLTANLTEQIRILRVTRDLLLPKLVSGEIDVSDLDIDTEWLSP